MSNYIIKKVTIKRTKVNYQENDAYTFHPKGNGYKDIKVSVIDNALKEGIFRQKIENDYKKIVAKIYDILNSTSDDDSANTLVAYTELDRLKQLFMYKYEEKVNRKLLEQYLKKMSILEIELEKMMVNLYRNRQMNIEEERIGKAR